MTPPGRSSSFRAAQSWRPELKGLTIMANSIYNGQRFEDLWLDK